MKRQLALVGAVLILFGLAAPAPSEASGKPATPPARPARVLDLKTGRFDPAVSAPGAAARNLAPGERGLYVVQFRDVITDDSWKAMRLSGAEVDTYLPDFAFLVRTTPEQAKDLGQSDLVRSVVRYRPDWKLAPGLAAQGGALRIHTMAGDEFTVDTLARGLGAQVAHAESGLVVAAVNRSAIAALLRSESVTFVDEVREHTLVNNVAAGLLNVSTTGGPWTNGLTGTGQIVGIADTGLDTGNTTTLNPDLRGRLAVTPIALGRPNNWSDTDGHGTHVAGSVVGDGTSGATDGGVTIKGMAPGAKLVFQSVLDSTGGLGGIPADLNTLFSQSYSNGARVHSNSWGVPLASGGWVYDAEAQQVDQYTFAHKDFTVLFAAGNDGSAANSVTTPSTAKNAITVGASENNRPAKGTYSDNPATIAVFSSRGNAPDGRLKPDVVSPGTWILSTRSTLAPDANYWGTFDTYHAYDSGTSMATPITAGATALVRQFYTDVKAITPNSSLIKATLINGAQDLGYGWMSKDQGWGRVDLINSLYPTGGRTNWFENEGNSLATSGSKSYSFNVTSGQILKVSLVWADYQGAVQASKELVNDLDLQVTAPGGAVYKGNCFVSNTASTSCAAFDRINNVENVYMAAPTTGIYTVQVSGFNVPNGPQPYSLVVSGNAVSLSTGGDTTPPTVSITAPTAGATVSGTTTVSATAADNVGVTKVEFYLDSALQSTDTTSPYSWSWNTSTATNGSHSLTTKAYDAAGNVTTSAAVAVTVSNAGSTTANETFTGSISSGSQYYYIDVSATGTVALNLSWPTTSNDFDLYLFNPAGTQVASSALVANPETISYSATTTGRYKIQVLDYSGSGTYTLTASQPINTAVTGSVSQAGSLATGASQSYALTVGALGSIDLKLNFPAGADYDLYLLNSVGTTVASATSANLNPETISYAVSGAGSYTMKVTAYSGSGSFTLSGYYPK